MQNPLRFTWPLVVARRTTTPASPVSATPLHALDVPITAIWPSVVADLATQPLWPTLYTLVLMSAPVWVLMLVHEVSTWGQFVQTGSILKLYQGPEPGAIALRVMLLCLGRSALRIWWRYRAIAKSAHTLSAIGPALLMGEITHVIVSLAAAVCLAPVLSVLYFDAAASWHVWMGFEQAAMDSWQQIVWHTITALWPQAELAMQFKVDWAPVWLRLPLGVGLLVISRQTCWIGMPSRLHSQPNPSVAFHSGWPWLMMKHLMAVWGLVFLLHSLLIEAPIALVAHGLLPHVVRTTGFVTVIPIASVLSTLCALLASAGWLMLATSYECRLIEALTSPHASGYRPEPSSHS